MFGDYYNLDADYSKVGAGKTVTVTVSDAWNFISVSKVYANGTECAAGSEAGEFTFTMPEKDVTVTAEVTVNVGKSRRDHYGGFPDQRFPPR